MNCHYYLIMKVFTFVLSLMNANHAYGFKTNNLLMNSGMGGFYKGPTHYQQPVKKSDTLYDPPTNMIDCNRDCNTNFRYENYGFYKGPTQRENKSDTLYELPSRVYKPTKENTYTSGFYVGPTSCMITPESTELLYQPSNKNY